MRQVEEEHVGVAGLRAVEGCSRVYEMGVHLRPQFWGVGLATEACRAVIKHAFDAIGADALFAGHNPKNKASRKTILKLGFEYTHDEFYKPTGPTQPRSSPFHVLPAY